MLVFDALRVQRQNKYAPSTAAASTTTPMNPSSPRPRLPEKKLGPKKKLFITIVPNASDVIAPSTETLLGIS